jgi:hypothetical protein
MLVELPSQAQAGAQRAQQLLAGHQPADDVHRGRVEGGGELHEARPPRRIAEVARRVLVERAFGLVEQRRGVERHEAARVAADRIRHRVEPPHPVGTAVALRHRSQAPRPLGSHRAGSTSVVDTPSNRAAW